MNQEGGEQKFTVAGRCEDVVKFFHVHVREAESLPADRRVDACYIPGNIVGPALSRCHFRRDLPNQFD